MSQSPDLYQPYLGTRARLRGLGQAPIALQSTTLVRRKPGADRSKSAIFAHIPVPRQNTLRNIPVPLAPPRPVSPFASGVAPSISNPGRHYQSFLHQMAQVHTAAGITQEHLSHGGRISEVDDLEEHSSVNGEPPVDKHPQDPVDPGTPDPSPSNHGDGDDDQPPGGVPPGGSPPSGDPPGDGPPGGGPPGGGPPGGGPPSSASSARSTTAPFNPWVPFATQATTAFTELFGTLATILDRMEA